MTKHFGLRIRLENIAVILSILLVISNKAYSEDIKDTNYKKPKIPFFLYVGIGFPMATTSPEFFKDYNNVIGGNQREFKPTAEYNAGIKIELYENFRFGLALRYFRSFISEFYTQADSIIEIDPPSTKKWSRSVTQDLDITSYPVLLTAEIIPIKSLYSTFAGLGIGVVVRNIRWTETIETSVQDTRKGGMHYDELTISPAAKIYSGVELCFDRNDNNPGFLHSLIIQAECTFVFGKDEIFKDVYSQFQGVTRLETGKKYTILPAYISLNMGVSFNLHS